MAARSMGNVAFMQLTMRGELPPVKPAVEPETPVAPPNVPPSRTAPPETHEAVERETMVAPPNVVAIAD